MPAALGRCPAFSWWKVVLVLALSSSISSLQIMYIAAARKVCDSLCLIGFMAYGIYVCTQTPSHPPEKDLLCSLL